VGQLPPQGYYLLLLLRSGSLYYLKAGLKAGNSGGGITLPFKPCNEGSYAERSATNQDQDNAVHRFAIWSIGE
jgi:hypothetical protein